MKTIKNIWIGIVIAAVILSTCGCKSKGFSYRTLEKYANSVSAKEIDSPAAFYMIDENELEWARYISVRGEDSMEVFTKLIDQRHYFAYSKINLTRAFYMKMREKVDERRNIAITEIYMLTFDTAESAQFYFANSHHDGIPTEIGKDYSYFNFLKKNPRGIVGSCMYLKENMVMRFYTNMPISEGWELIRKICKDFDVIIPETN